jgi:diaminopimelate decarboxylase
MTGNTQLLISSVLNIKETKERTFAIMDAGINHAEAVRNEYHQLYPVNRFGYPTALSYVLTGPICSPGDVLYPSIALPKLSVGDTVAIMDAGAYFVPFSTSFSFPRPAIVLVEDGSVSIARRAETYEDLVACDSF